MAENKDRWYHYFYYLAAGGTMGGLLDVTAFHMRTPIYGIITGMVIATLYQIVIWKPWKRF